MEAEKVMELFESLWFFNIKKLTSDSYTNSDHETTIPRSLSQHKRSMSDDQTTMMMTPSSPDSVLLKSPRTLHTIVLGTEITEESYTAQVLINEKKAVAMKSKRRRTSKLPNQTKSMSDLEFEELKGLMDLGFIFSEEDNQDPRLLEIVPGLHRLSGIKESSSFGSEDGGGRRNDKSREMSRPYLSETWQVFDKKQSPKLKDWKIPSSSVEIDMKKNLRSWAHIVASTLIR